MSALDRKPECGSDCFGPKKHCFGDVAGCETNECYYIKRDTAPYGINFIPGSNKLVEYPQYNYLGGTDSNPRCVTDLLVESVNAKCPRVMSGTTCISECCQLKAAECINFINGDLIIRDDGSSNLPPSNDPLGRLAQSACQCELHNIFPNLLGINGSLYMVGTNYTKITGFEKLKYVTGSIVIVNNAKLVEMPSFPSLVSVSSYQINPQGSDSYNCSQAAESDSPPFANDERVCNKSSIVIASNPLLRKIVGFEAVRQVKDGIVIMENICLSHIAAFIHLYRTDRIIIQCNPRLSKILGFCYIDSINQSLVIANNNILGHYDLVINAFLALDSVGQFLFIGNVSTRIVDFPSLRLVRKDLVIRGNPSLGEINVGVQYVDNLFIENNISLQKVAFPNLTEVNKNLNFTSNGGVVSLNTFDKLKRIGGGLLITDNKFLTELRGFNELKYIGSNCLPRTTINCSEPDSTCPCVPCVALPLSDSAPLDPNYRAIRACTSNDPELYSQIWALIFNSGSELCGVINNLDLTIFDNQNCPASSINPIFFNLICASDNTCRGTRCKPCRPIDDSGVSNGCCYFAVNYSVLIFNNPRLKAIGGFENLKHIESSIFIVNNSCLHTVNSFNQLCYVLDIWIRNNPGLKYLYAFQNLHSARDVTVLEAPCLVEWNSLKNLEYVQTMSLESKTSRAIRFGKQPVPSVLGFLIYYNGKGRECKKNESESD